MVKKYLIHSLLLAALVAAGLVLADSRATMDAPIDVIEKARVPLQRYPTGQVRSLLRAKVARVFANATLRAENVEVEMYDTEGVLNGIMVADDIAVDQRRGSGRSEGPVRLEYTGIRIDGIGMTWKSADNLIRIESNVVVQLDRKGKSLVEGWK